MWPPGCSLRHAFRLVVPACIRDPGAPEVFSRCSALSRLRRSFSRRSPRRSRCCRLQVGPVGSSRRRRTSMRFEVEARSAVGRMILRQDDATAQRDHCMRTPLHKDATVHHSSSRHGSIWAASWSKVTVSSALSSRLRWPIRQSGKPALLSLYLASAERTWSRHCICSWRVRSS